jgi:hypothetical protein
MKKRILFVSLIISLLLGACVTTTVQEGAEWLNEPNFGGNQKEQSIDIPNSDVYEVTASKLDIAIMELQQTSVSKLSPELAVWYTGHYYNCPPGKNAYLVRAVYGHAGTGAFSLKQIDDSLLIIHQSLGRSIIYRKTALVVNLDYEPDQIYLRVSIAE